MSQLPWRQLSHVWKEKCCGYSHGEDILFSKQDNSMLFDSREVRIGKMKKEVFPNTDRPRLVNNIYIFPINLTKFFSK